MYLRKLTARIQINFQAFVEISSNLHIPSYKIRKLIFIEFCVPTSYSNEFRYLPSERAQKEKNPMIQRTKLQGEKEEKKRESAIDNGAKAGGRIRARPVQVSGANDDH